MTTVQLFEKIDETMVLNLNAQKLKEYLGTKNLSEDQKEIVLNILEDKDLQNMLDIRKIQSIKKIFGDK